MRILYDTATEGGGGSTESAATGGATTALTDSAASPSTDTGATTTNPADAKVITGTAGSVLTTDAQADESLKWLEAIPDEIRNDPSMAPIKDLPGLARSFVNSQKMVGADKVVIPGENSTDEEWNNFYNKVGRPQTVEEYKVDVPKGTEIDEAFFGGFKSKAHEMGLSNRQVQSLFGWYQGEVSKLQEGQTTTAQVTAEAGIKQLQESWGGASEKNMVIAQTAVNEIDEKIPGFKEWLDKGPGNDAMMIQLVHMFGSNFMEDTIKNNAVVSGFTTVSPDEAQKKINEIRNNPEHAWNKTSQHPGHGDAVKEMNKLYELKHAAADPDAKPFGTFRVGGV